MYKVLIADDNKQIVSILSEYCKKNNFTVSTVFDGETALKEIEEIKTIDVKLVWYPAWSPEKMSRYARIALGIR